MPRLRYDFTPAEWIWMYLEVGLYDLDMLARGWLTWLVQFLSEFPGSIQEVGFTRQHTLLPSKGLQFLITSKTGCLCVFPFRSSAIPGLTKLRHGSCLAPDLFSLVILVWWLRYLLSDFSWQSRCCSVFALGIVVGGVLSVLTLLWLHWILKVLHGFSLGFHHVASKLPHRNKAQS